MGRKFIKSSLAIYLIALASISLSIYGGMRWSTLWYLLYYLGSYVASQDDAVFFTNEERTRILSHSPLGPLPIDRTNAYADNPQAAELGQRIFFDKRFSGNGQVACATCHNPDTGWSDGKKISEGIGKTRRHTPSLWNTAYNRWFFWDGRADTQWSQALRPLEQPKEHGGTRLQFAHLIFDDFSLKDKYEDVFGPLPDLSDTSRFPLSGRPAPSSQIPQLAFLIGRSISSYTIHPHHRNWILMSQEDQEAINRVFANIGKAIAAFERRIVSRRSSFDVFVAGLNERNPEKLVVLSPAAQRGAKLFVGKANCQFCHSGPNFTDGEFNNLSISGDDPQNPDPGRLEGIAQLIQDPFNSQGPYSDDNRTNKVRLVRRQADDLGKFKTPTLRNIAKTAPYMHNGHFQSLKEVVEFYSNLAAPEIGHHREEFLVPLGLSDQEMEALVAFLESLTDETSNEFLRESLVISEPTNVIQ